MSLDKLEKWSKVFATLTHPIRLSILFMLYQTQIQEGSRSLTFSQILEVLNLSNSSTSNNTLVYHLAKLQETSFVEKIPSQDKETGRIYPIYLLTEKGKEFLEDFELKSRMIEYLEDRKLQKETEKT